jgi:H+/Cl- antiporter ClcA
MTWVYNNTGRSILSAVLLHFLQSLSLDLVSGLHGAPPTGYFPLVAALLGLLAAAVATGWGAKRLTGKGTSPIVERL